MTSSEKSSETQNNKYSGKSLLVVLILGFASSILATLVYNFARDLSILFYLLIISTLICFSLVLYWLANLVGKYNLLQYKATEKEKIKQDIRNLETEINNLNQKCEGYRTKITNNNALLSVFHKAKIEQYIETLKEADAKKFISDNFIKSKKVYIMASRGYQLLGPEIEPFHQLLTSKDIHRETDKDIRILLSNPLFNLERTKKTARISDDDKILQTFKTTIQQIMEYKQHINLSLKIYHHTAQWRLILFDEGAMLSSYSHVYQLPIYILRSGKDSLYEGFLYHFNKLSEFSEEVNDMNDYNNIIERTRNSFDTNEFMIKIGDNITGF